MINVVCVKTGTKYDYEFVNRLYRMVEKNLSLPFDFYCLTEMSDGIRKEVKIVDISEIIEEGIDGFWPKLLVFNPDIYEKVETTLYLDLDVFVQNSIDYLFEDINSNKIKICYGGSDKDLIDIDISNGKFYNTEVNSSIMIFKSDQFKNIFENFMINPYSNISTYKGVCRLLWNQYKDKIMVSRKAHPLWDLSHCILSTKLPLKKFYRLLLKTYAKTCLDIKRANKLSLRTRPSVFSYRYLRLWFGAIKIFIQFISAHRHHNRKNIMIAENCGPELTKINSEYISKPLGDLSSKIKVGRII